MNGDDSAREGLLRFLADEGHVFTPLRGGDHYKFISRLGTDYPLHPVLTIPEDLFQEYLEEQARHLNDEPDPFAEALSLAMINVMEELDTDHGDGLNYTRALGYRRDRSGKVRFFVDQERPKREQVPPSPDLEWVAYPPDSSR
jgi:hypothetical protein